jgi:hypothetical protein
MYIKAANYQSQNASPVINLRCPWCKQRGTFHPVPNTYDVLIQEGGGSYKVAGSRRCPNPECYALVFFATDSQTKLLVSYPPERLDFDATNIPSPVSNAIAEAITCHANECYIAAAIMVRKTLEELCRDRNAQGKNLKDRLKDLGTRVVLPKELFDGLDDLRLLGNDAAHIESQEFNNIGREEIEIGIEFSKEVLKAVYQYTTLLERLRSLKKP